MIRTNLDDATRDELQGLRRTPLPPRVRDRIELVALYFLGECGFTPTLPLGYSWSLPRHRKLIRYEASQGQRVNALAAYRPLGRSLRLEVFTAERTRDSHDLLGFLKALPWSRGLDENSRFFS